MINNSDILHTFHLVVRRTECSNDFLFQKSMYSDLVVLGFFNYIRTKDFHVNHVC